MRIRIIQSFEPDNSGKLNDIVLNLDNYLSDLNNINIDNDLSFELKYDAIPFEPKPCNFKIKKKKKLKQALANDIIHILYPEVDPSLWRTYIVKDCIFSIPHKKIISILIDGRYYITDINRNCYLQLITILKSLKRSKKIAFENFKQNINNFNRFDENSFVKSSMNVNSSNTSTPISSNSVDSYSSQISNSNLALSAASNNSNLIALNDSKSSLSCPLNSQNLMVMRNDLSLYTTPPSTPPQYLGNYYENEKLLEDIARQIDFISQEKNIFFSIFIQSLINLNSDVKKQLILSVSNIFNNLNIDFDFNKIFSNNILKNNDIKSKVKKEINKENDIPNLNESNSILINNDDCEIEIFNNKAKESNIENINLFFNILHNKENNNDIDNDIDIDNENDNENDKKPKHKKKKSKSNLKNRKNKKEGYDDENKLRTSLNQQYNINFYINKNMIYKSYFFCYFKF